MLEASSILKEKLHNLNFTWKRSMVLKQFSPHKKLFSKLGSCHSLRYKNEAYYSWLLQNVPKIGFWVSVYCNAISMYGELSFRTYHIVGIWFDSRTPHPWVLLSNGAKPDPLLGMQTALFVTSSHHNIFSFRKPIHTGRITPQHAVFANLKHTYPHTTTTLIELGFPAAQMYHV